VIVYFHGGGYVVMSPETHEKLTKQLCVGTGAVVVSVDYRLAPEHRYPAPLDDCLAAFRWVRAHARELGGDPARIAAGGDSAGGNAAAAVTLRLLAAGEAPPTALLLLCPWTDMALDTDSMRRFGPDDGVLDTDIMTWFRDCYVVPSNWNDPFASPLRGDLAKFPPTLVVVGEIDPLLDDGLQLVKKLEQAGRKVVLQSHAGMPHDFMLFPGIDEGAVAIDGICRFAKSALGG
jgi:acetyl esterase